uniref:proline dehydrogenase family protein n=1 Tax=Helicobacter trogontum TaxID=50960 RepID=UPI000CF12BA5
AWGVCHLKTLVAFSKERVQGGKPPIKIRIVKGANMEAEETIASVKGWELPTFRRKVDTDSNYNKMLDYILQDSNFKYIDIGIASHNIFQIAYAMTKINMARAQDSFTFEMLEGMNLKASFEVASRNKLILYAPVCSDAHFNNAIAYLVRRLDENTGKDNFMRYAFDLEIDSAAWKQQEQIFLQSLEGMQSVQDTSYRQQNRLQAPFTQKAGLNTFFNEPDTDFILKPNREWAEAIKTKWLNAETFEVMPIIGEQMPKENKREIQQKGGDKVIANVYLASRDSLRSALDYVKHPQNTLSYEQLGEILLKTAELVAERRNDLIGISALEVGKTFAETDAEVSEAIDFLRFYPHSMRKLLETHKDCVLKPKGIGVVITPWNFPVAISVGGIAASLASGNRVIYKPSNISAVTGSMLTQCFYDAGLPKDYLVFLPASGKDINEFLLKEADFAILTGGEDTAYEILKENPTLLLSAETGGKNATIVSKMADRDQAVKNIIHSAFSNSGQKCSATSLLILEEEVYKDEQFKRTLIDAAQSLHVGNPFEFKNKLGYLSSTIDEKVKQGLELEEGEEWVLAPSFEDNNPYAMRPCIKYGVKEGSYSHKNEFFTPILSVMCAKNLEHAINIANSTGYGLTSGFESLDEREWDYYLKHIEAGNLYINKSTTGAIVLRQPFGGIKKSAVGFGRKAGSYNYVAQFLDICPSEAHKVSDLNVGHTFIDSIQYLINTTQDEGRKNELKEFLQTAKSYAYFHENEFLQKRDFVHIRGEDNLFYYIPVKSIIYRARKEDSLSDILSIVASAQMINAQLTISLKATEVSESLGFVLEQIKPLCLKNITIEYQSLEQFVESAGQYELIRYLAVPDSENLVYKELIGQGRAKGKLIAYHKPYINGYFELLFYHTERAASIAFHRYGNLGRRALSNIK